MKLEDAIPIYCDNKSCTSIARNPVMHSRTKHIDVKYHFIRGLVTEHQIQLEFCKSKEQLADLFTKCLDAKKQIYFRNALGACDLQSGGSYSSE